ncbi:hypothetical protein B0H14DRAFT_531196 [Mycena olivaceomarginata]|nr:hypothetical protein B0H14DRAFT_531196 [Mycena olivaceomarginata]
MLVVITCRIPTLFHLVWTGFPPKTAGAIFSSPETVAGFLSYDLFSIFYNWTGYHNVMTVNLTVTAHACCHCDPAGSPETTTLLEPPCSSAPPRMKWDLRRGKHRGSSLRSIDRPYLSSVYLNNWWGRAVHTYQCSPGRRYGG